MARTTVPGNRIQEGAIENRHLHPDFRISEENIEFKIEPHLHGNKEVLDIIRNSIPQTLTLLDLKDVLYTIIEVSDARDLNKTLRQTLDGKASQEQIDTLVEEIQEARRGYSSLSVFFEEFERSIDQQIAEHVGSIPHFELDATHAEVKAARGNYNSLKERLDDVGTGGGGGGGTVNVHMLTPWHFQTTLQAGQTIVEFTNTYTPGNTTLQVYEGPILLLANVDYKEISPTQIEFFAPFEEDVLIRAIGVGAGRLFEWERRVSGNNSITRIELADSYRVGERELMIYEDGVLLQVDEDYVELSPNSLQFRNPIPTGSSAIIYRRRH